MTIKSWPKHERPREKVLAHGAQKLSDAELVALFLRSGTKGKSAVDIARELLQQLGSLRGLFGADFKQFCQQPCLSPIKYAEFQAVVEIGKRFLEQKIIRTDVFANTLQTRRYVIARMRDYHQEIFAALFLDSKNRLLAFEELSRGTLHQANVYPREVIRHVLRHNAASVIFAHNHPSGDTAVSEADKELTRTLIAALALIDVRVLDHFIVGDGEITSLAERGVI